MNDEDFTFVIRSETDVDNFKSSVDRKKELVKKCNKPYDMPVVVYVKNPEIPDIKTTTYVLHCFSSIADLLEMIKKSQEKTDKCYKYGLKPEFFYSNEIEDFLMEDVLLQEVWEDYKNIGDKFLYLILDKI